MMSYEDRKDYERMKKAEKYNKGFKEGYEAAKKKCEDKNAKETK